MQLTRIIIPLLFICVTMLIRAEFRNNHKQIYFFKPISTLLIIFIAVYSFLLPQHNSIYSIGILVGLLLCFGGDMALMFPKNAKAFAIGLRLFLLGHVAYTVTFILLTTFSASDIINALFLLVAGIILFQQFKPNLGEMKIPVMLYIIIISVMVNRAAATLSSDTFNGQQSMLICGGAILFYISDVILAANRYWRDWKYNRISLAFYYAGQLLLACAAVYF